MYSENDQIDLKDILAYFLNHKLFIFITSTVGFLSGYTLSLVVTPQYKSEVQLFIESNKSPTNLGGVASLLGMSAGALSAEDAKILPILASKDLSRKFLVSHHLVQDILPPKDDGVMPKPLDAAKVFLKKNLHTQLSKTKDILTISITFSDSLKTFEMVNSFSKFFIKTLDEFDRNKNDSAQLFYLNKIKEVNMPEIQHSLQQLLMGEIKKSLIIGKNKFRVIDPATIAENPIFPNKKIFALLGLTLSLLFCFIFILIKRYFNSKKAVN